MTNKSGYFGVRFVLGMIDSGLTCGPYFVLSTWLRRDECLKHFMFAFSGCSVGGAIAGIIAYGMHTLDGKLGIAHWRWIFIIEGAIISFLAIVLYFWIDDFPETAKFLSENERAFVVRKLELDHGKNGDKKITLPDVLSVFRDWRLYVAGFMYYGGLTGAFGYANFATAILKPLASDPMQIQVKSIYPWVLSAGGSVLVGLLSDYLRHRFFFVFSSGAVTVVGYAMLLGLDAADSDGNPLNVEARYAALFLITFGLFCNLPLTGCWALMNVSGHHRKLVVAGWYMGFCATGGIISSFDYRTQDSPQFSIGIGVSMALMMFSMLVACLNYAVLRRINKSRREDDFSTWDQLNHHEKCMAGDLNPKFTYQL